MDTPDVLHCVRAGLEGAGQPVDGLQYCRPVSGGIVNQAALFTTGQRNYFVKWNTKECTRSMFQSEHESLEVLRKTSLFRVPTSYQVCEDHTPHGGLHVLEYIEDLQPCRRWAEMGTQAARLHSLNSKLVMKSRHEDSRIHAPADPWMDPSSPTDPWVDPCTLGPVERFGFQHPTYLGNFTPGAVWRDSWEAYFIRDILNGLFDLVDEKYGIAEVREGWSNLQRHVHKVFRPAVTIPELLHGDLCPANFGQTDTQLVLFDPSCLYGDPDFDLFLSVAEGGFHEDFFAAYRSVIPQAQGHDNKMTLYSLFYHLIMWCHVDEAQFKQGTIKSINTIDSLLRTI